MAKIEQDMIPVIKNLAVQIVFYASLASIFVDGFKQELKLFLGMSEDESLHRVIPLILIVGSSLGLSFLLKSELIENLGVRLVFGLLMSTTVFVIYKSVLQGLLAAIPAFFKKFLGK